MVTQPPSPQSGWSPSRIFRPISIVAKRLDASRYHLVWMEVGLCPGDFVLDGNPAHLSKKGAEPSPQFFGPFLLWPNYWMHQDATWYGGRPWSSPHCARWGHSSPPQNRGQSPLPKFSAHLYCGQMAGCIKMPLGTEVGLGLRDMCSMWTQLPPEKGHTHPTQFLGHVYCGQMAGWMKTPLGTEVDLGPGHIVLDGVPGPAKGAQRPPSFWPMSIVTMVAHLSYC